VASYPPCRWLEKKSVRGSGGKANRSRVLLCRVVESRSREDWMGLWALLNHD
jgi:hypothetical protein